MCMAWSCFECRAPITCKYFFPHQPPTNPPRHAAEILQQSTFFLTYYVLGWPSLHVRSPPSCHGTQDQLQYPLRSCYATFLCLTILVDLEFILAFLSLGRSKACILTMGPVGHSKQTIHTRHSHTPTIGVLPHKCCPCCLCKH